MRVHDELYTAVELGNVVGLAMHDDCAVGTVVWARQYDDPLMPTRSGHAGDPLHCDGLLLQHHDLDELAVAPVYVPVVWYTMTLCADTFAPTSASASAIAHASAVAAIRVFI